MISVVCGAVRVGAFNNAYDDYNNSYMDGAQITDRTNLAALNCKRKSHEPRIVEDVICYTAA